MAPVTPTMAVSICFVGCGDIFAHHLAGIVEHPDLYTVAATCDPDAERAPPPRAATVDACGCE